MSINLTQTFTRNRFPVIAGTIVMKDGTWRPALSDESGNEFTMTTITGTFRLIHDMCWYTGRVVWSDIGAAVGSDDVLLLLPFPAKEAVNNWGVTRQTTTTGYIPSTDIGVNSFVSQRIAAGESVARFVTTRTLTGGKIMVVSNMDPSNGQYDFSGSYMIAVPGDAPTPIN